MKNLKLIAAVSVIALGATTLVVEARGDGPGRGGHESGAMFGGEMPSFADLDVNGDGSITTEDLTAMRDARFAEVDTDGNGSVSREEFMAHASGRAGDRAGRMFDRLDADGDGALSLDALAGGRGGDRGARMIERADADGDGAVSEEEFAAAIEKMGARHERGGRHGRGER